MNITLRQLRAFAEVARRESFTRAAEALHLTQPAVSMQIKQLEDLLGIPLFEHFGRRIVLTEAGREVQHYARAVSEQLDELALVLDGLKGLERGRLRIAAITTANYFVPKLLAAFGTHHPGVTVSLDIGNREMVLQRLGENDADLAIMGRPPGGRNLEAKAFLDNPLIIAAPPDHPLAGQTAIPLKRLEDETFLLREPGSGTRNAMERFFKSHGLRLTTGMEISSLVAIKQGVAAGLGLALVQRHALEMELALGRVAVLDVEGFPIRRHWYVAHRRGRRLSASADAFHRFILEEGAGVLASSDSGRTNI